MLIHRHHDALKALLEWHNEEPFLTKKLVKYIKDKLKMHRYMTETYPKWLKEQDQLSETERSQQERIPKYFTASDQ